VIILGVVIVVVALVGARMAFGGKSQKEIERTAKVEAFVIQAWRIKHDARLFENRDKLLSFKQQLMNYYSAESGALAEQQRLISALTAADIAAAKDDNSGEKILNFWVSDVSFTNEKVDDNNARLTADVEFYIGYRTQAQTYRTYGNNTYSWQLKKEQGKWKVTKEELVTTNEE
jgi:hypothetical protein